jgi:predicted transcriptional regulator
MADRPTIGRAELQVLRYVTDHHPVSVGDVARDFGREAGLARNTVLTVMERLRHKGYLTRRKSAGVYRYAPVVGKADVLRVLVRDFVEGALGGSLEPFMAYLAEEAELTAGQLEELKRLVRDLDAGEKGGRA